MSAGMSEVGGLEPNKTTEKKKDLLNSISTSNIYRIAMKRDRKCRFFFSLFGRYAFCFQRECSIGLELAGADTILYRHKLNKQ